MRVPWVAATLALLATGGLADTVTVQVQEARIRKEPRFFASSVATAELGDKLEVVSASGDWFEVTVGAQRGYIHTSSVTTKKVSLTTTKEVGAETTAEEVTLAGKGFNKEVEDQYRTEHPTYDFTTVDKIVARQPSERDLTEFRREGRLGEFGGGS
jgi:hypothetical protein